MKKQKIEVPVEAEKANAIEICFNCNKSNLLTAESVHCRLTNANEWIDSTCRHWRFYANSTSD